MVHCFWELSHSENQLSFLQLRNRIRNKDIYLFFIFRLFLFFIAKSLQSCPTLCDPVDCSLPGSSVQGILQERILEWIAMPSSRGSSWARDPTRISCVSCIAGRFFTWWAICSFQFSSVQSLSVSDSLRPHEIQHARPPCPSPTPEVHSSSCRSSQWYHPAISSSVVPFSSHSQSFPASGSFPMNQLCAWGSQSIGVSASASVLPMNSQDWHLEWTGWKSLWSKGLSRVFSNTRFKSINSSVLSFLHSPTLTSLHDHWKNQCSLEKLLA